MKTRRASYRLVALAAVLSGLGIVGLIHVVANNHAASARVAYRRAPIPIITDPAFNSPSPSPSALPVTTNRALPVRVVIPELHIDLPVVPGDGYDVPLYKAATYPAPLDLPGQGGRAMLYAHARDGMFGNLLLQGRVGQHVTVYLADGTTLHYVVRQYFKRWPSTQVQWLQPASHEELILETCTSYNPNDPRVIAVAEPAA